MMNSIPLQFNTVVQNLIRARTGNQAVYWFPGSFLFLFGQAKRKQSTFSISKIIV